MELTVACNEGRGKNSGRFESMCNKDGQKCSQGERLAVFLLDEINEPTWLKHQEESGPRGLGSWKAKGYAGGRLDPRRLPQRTRAAPPTCESVPLSHEGHFLDAATARVFSMPGRPQVGLSAGSDCLLWPAAAEVKQRMTFTCTLHLKRKWPFRVTLLREVCFLHNLRKRLNYYF